MSNEQYTNPATVMLDFLNQLNPANNVQLAVRLCSIFKLNATNHQDIAKALTLFNKIVQNLSQLVEKNEYAKSGVEFVIPDIIELINPYHLSRGVKDIHHGLKSKGVFTALNIMSGFLQNPIYNATVKIVNTSELDNISKSVCDLMNEVMQSDLDPTLKETLFRELNEINESIRLYHFIGADFLQSNIDKLAGSIMRQRTIWDAAKDTGTKVFDKIINIVKSVNFTIMNGEMTYSINFLENNSSSNTMTSSTEVETKELVEE